MTTPRVLAFVQAARVLVFIAPVSADALGAVEGGGVEPGLARQTRRRQAIALGERVDRAPDLIMGQHRGKASILVVPTGRKAGIEIGNIPY